MEKYHILLGMPGPHIRFQNAQSAFCCVGKGHRVDVVGADSESWDNMNVLWMTALNAARKEGVTHYAQIHADIVPALDQDWINVLLAEMEKFNADFISAVVPIKDGRGLTSCGIGDPQDPWVPLRRFTMHEIYSFPETFGQNEIGYPQQSFYLNHNSGMILADLRNPVFRKTKPDGELAIWFEFKKRMHIQPDGEVKLQGESEDWNISRRLWENGARTCITRKPVLKHYGATGYPNTYAWGEQVHDEACRYKWQRFDPIGEIEVSPESRKMPVNDPVTTIRGWLAGDEQAELEQLAIGKEVVEFGSYCGKSTVAMARVAKHVTAVDDFRGVPAGSRLDSAGLASGTESSKALYEEFMANILRCGVHEKVTVVKRSSEDALSCLDMLCFDAVFFDADHSFEATYQCGRVLLERTRPDCTVAFHDYGTGDPGVVQAVDQLARETGRRFRVINTLAIFDGVTTAA